MDDRVNRLRLRAAIEAEIMRRVRELDDHMTREEVERIGAQEGVAPEEAVQMFLSLKGATWEGRLASSASFTRPLRRTGITCASTPRGSKGPEGWPNPEQLALGSLGPAKTYSEATRPLESSV